jgi:predicted transcriptional regulator
MNSRPSNNTLLAWTTQILSSYLKNNAVPVAELPGLISSIYETLGATTNDVSIKLDAKPAVAIRRSVTPDYIVCLEDGKKLKMLKRYLRTAYNMTPEEYRQKWALPSDYPMVAPNYAIQRSVLAKKIGLGNNRRRGSAVK